MINISKNVTTLSDLEYYIKKDLEECYLSDICEYEDQDQEAQIEDALNQLVENYTIYNADVLQLLGIFAWEGTISLNEQLDNSIVFEVTFALDELVREIYASSVKDL